MKKILQKLEQEIDNPYWNRGKQYYKEGMISDVVQNKDEINAKCEGNSVYRLKIELNNKEMTCSCPCDFHCKHLAALLFWLRKNRPLVLNSLDKELVKLSKKELIACLKTILKKYPEAYKHLQAIDKEEIASLIKKLWIPRYEYNASFFNELEYIKEQILSVKDFKLIEQFTRKLIDMFDHDSDSHELDSVICEFLEEVDENISLTKLQRKELRKILPDYPFGDYL